MKCFGNLTCLIDPSYTSDVYKLCGCDTKHVPSEDMGLCVNNSVSVFGSVWAILFMFITGKLF